MKLSTKDCGIKKKEKRSKKERNGDDDCDELYKFASIA